MLLSQADHRPAHLTRVRDALTALPESDQVRLGVTEDWKTGPHQLTYRQTERTFGLAARALEKDQPDGTPPEILAAICDKLPGASIPDQFKDATTALAVDWTDVETFSRPPPHGTSDCADPEASWGHRSGGGPGQDSELFFGYYASAATMMREENGPPVPELARRMTVCSCHTDPARALVPVLTAMPAAGIPLGDILDDSGYAHRDADAWAIPLRQAGAQLVQDLHPADRGPRGTHEGAIIAMARRVGLGSKLMLMVSMASAARACRARPAPRTRSSRPSGACCRPGGCRSSARRPPRLDTGQDSWHHQRGMTN